MNEASRKIVQESFRLYPGEAARRLELATPKDAAKVMSAEPPLTIAELLRRMEPSAAAEVLSAFDDRTIEQALPSIDPAYTASLLARLLDSERERLLALAPEALREEILGILDYPAGTAGRLMDARVRIFREHTNVREALNRVRELRDRRVSDLVITDDDGNFQGVVRLQDAVGAEPEQLLRDLKSPRSVFVHPIAPREEVVELLNHHHLASLPVVDLQNQVIGVIRHDGLVDAAQQDAVAAMQQMVGGSREERALSPPWVGVKSRLPWLHINLVTAFVAAGVVGLFEGTIARFTAVAVLLPVVAGQSGNTGAQALAVTMRGLALREIRTSHAGRVLLKELAVGFINGIAIAVVTSIAVYLWSQNFGLALVMFLAMIIAMLAASAAGALIPIVLVKLGRDPATASSIILTTVTDVVGFFAFLGLATVLAGMLAASQ